MKGLKKGLTLAAAAVLILTQGPCGLKKVWAEEVNPAADPSHQGQEELVHVELPAFPEEDGSVFDFIMDPQGLIEATDAAKYDGASFEKGRTLYFKNEEGEYAYSGSSDRLTVTNKSTVPVEVTVTAKLEHCEGIDLSLDEKFSDGNGELFLALTDDRGAVTPLKGAEEISVTGRLDAAAGQGAVTYSFGLTGSCNPDGDWESVLARPVVTVTWKVTPLLPEEKKAASDETKPISGEETVPGEEETETADSETTDSGLKPPAPSDEMKPDQSVSSNNKLG